MPDRFDDRGRSIAGKQRVVVVGLEQDVVPEADIAVVLDDKNLFVTHDRKPPK
jgi:hypothetical protein